MVIFIKDRFSISQAGVSLVQLGEGELSLLELVRETVLNQALRHLNTLAKTILKASLFVKEIMRDESTNYCMI